MSASTVVYYTCNGDYQVLENAVRETIVQNCGDLPIVSVSHEPISFGQNFCVGHLAKSPEHALMQLRIGAQLAKTKFLVICEADTLYPPQFFQFIPPRTDTYYYPRNGYVLFYREKIYRRKRLCELMGVVARDHVLRILDELQDREQTIMQRQTAGEDVYLPIKDVIPACGGREFVDLGSVVTIKTQLGMHMQNEYMRGHERRSLPIWGSAEGVLTTYRCE